MTEDRTWSRRGVLATVAGTALAGCSSGSEETTGPTTNGEPSTEPSTTTRSRTRPPENTPLPTPGSEGVVRDVVFRRTPERDLKLDLYVPQEGEEHPFVVFAHGGAWIMGDKGERPMFDEMVAEGYAVADIQYRLATEKKYPAAVRDTAAAVKWVRDTAPFGIDGTTGALAGYSAGAHLAALVGFAPEHETFQPVEFKPEVSAAVDAVVGYSGPYDFTTPESEGNELIANFFGEDASDETLAEGSPVTHVDSEDPPALLLHGTNDVVVPTRSTTVLAAALRDAGVPVEEFIGDGAGHRMINNPEWREQTLPLQQQFLDERLQT